MTQTTAAYITHFLIFNSAKNIGILAQLTGQAQEILERVQMSYEQLPLFIQPGVRMYNKRSFMVHSKSKIMAYSSTSTSVRGKSFACVDGKTKIKVRNKITGLVEELYIEQLKESLVRI